MVDANASPSGFECSIRPEVSSVWFSEQRSLRTVVSLKAPELVEDFNRGSLDLVMIIDTSGSMGSNQKLKLVQEMLSFSILHLKACDRLAIVSFSNSSDTNLPLTCMDEEGRKKASKAIRSLQSHGSTNLSGGIIEGFNILVDREQSANVSSVLLMTDGHANLGITDSETLQACLDERKRAVQSELSMYVFGFGSDHNDQLLGSLAESAGGLYNFIESSEQIMPSLASTLGGLLSVFAQNIRLKLECDNESQIESVRSQFKTKIADDQKSCTVDIRDMFSDENRDIPVVLKIPRINAPADAVSYMTAEVTFYAARQLVQENVSVVFHLDRPGDKPVEAQPDDEVVAQFLRVEAADALREALAEGRMGRVRDGAERLRKVREQVDQMPISQLSSNPMFSDLRDELFKAEQEMDESRFSSAGSKAVNSMMHTFAYQRNAGSSAQYVSPSMRMMSSSAEEYQKSNVVVDKKDASQSSSAAPRSRPRLPPSRNVNISSVGPSNNISNVGNIDSNVSMNPFGFAPVDFGPLAQMNESEIFQGVSQQATVGPILRDDEQIQSVSTPSSSDSDQNES